MGVHPDHRYLAVIFFRGKGGVPRFYVANSLMFGATAAVYAFTPLLPPAPLHAFRTPWFGSNKQT